MAVKKKARSKTKTKKAQVKKRATKRKATKKKVTRRPKAAKKRPATKKKSGRKSKALKKRPAARKPAAPKPKPIPPKKPAASLPSAGEERIGVVTHFYTHLSVAIIQMESGTLREGDTIHIKGHTSDFRQRVESMEINHIHVPQVTAGQVFGLRVTEHAREYDVVFKVAQ